MQKRFKNPYFWLGLVGVALTAAGISPESLTSWDILLDNLIGVLKNPYMLVSVGVAVLGIFVNPTTKGLKDSEEKEK